MLKNLLFDLGGVIMDIRRQDCIDACHKLGFNDIENYLGDYGQRDFFLALEEGKITPDQWREQVRAHLNRPATDAEINAAFNTFLLGIPPERLEALLALRRAGLHTYLLSNTNRVMWDLYILDSFQSAGLSINDYFDGIVTSFEVGICKPAPQIFKACEDKFGIMPDETLFFDDSEANCSAAARLGFHTVHVPPQSNFMAVLPVEIKKRIN